MALFTTLYSGSSGNCGLVREGNQYLLVDMGKSCRTTLTALRRLDLAISDCAGILVTHEHSDHVAGLDTFLKKYPIPVYSSADTLDALDSRGTLPPAVETSAMDGETRLILVRSRSALFLPATTCLAAATASRPRTAAAWPLPPTLAS